jgi:hypothetical protein
MSGFGMNSRVSRARKPDRITTQFLITVNTNRSNVNHDTLERVGEELFSDDSLARMAREGVFKEPEKRGGGAFDYDELRRRYDTGPGGVELPPRVDGEYLNYLDLPGQLVDPDDSNLKVVYGVEDGGRMNRTHMHMLTKFETRVPFQIDIPSFREYVKNFTSRLGLGRDFFPYINVKFAGNGNNTLEAYVAKNAVNPVKQTVIDDLADKMSQLGV